MNGINMHDYTLIQSPLTTSEIEPIYDVFPPVISSCSSPEIEKMKYCLLIAAIS